MQFVEKPFFKVWFMANSNSPDFCFPSSSLEKYLAYIRKAAFQSNLKFQKRFTENDNILDVFDYLTGKIMYYNYESDSTVAQQHNDYSDVLNDMIYFKPVFINFNNLYLPLSWVTSFRHKATKEVMIDALSVIVKQRYDSSDEYSDYWMDQLSYDIENNELSDKEKQTLARWNNRKVSKFLNKLKNRTVSVNNTIEQLEKIAYRKNKTLKFLCKSLIECLKLEYLPFNDIGDYNNDLGHDYDNGQCNSVELWNSIIIDPYDPMARYIKETSEAFENESGSYPITYNRLLLETKPKGYWNNGFPEKYIESTEQLINAIYEYYKRCIRGYESLNPWF